MRWPSWAAMAGFVAVLLVLALRGYRLPHRNRRHGCVAARGKGAAEWGVAAHQRAYEDRRGRSRRPDWDRGVAVGLAAVLLDASQTVAPSLRARASTA